MIFDIQQRACTNPNLALNLTGQLRAYFWYITSNRWLAVRLETVGTVIVTSAALLAVGEKGTLAAGLAGLSISYALNVTQSLNWCQPQPELKRILLRFWEAYESERSSDPNPGLKRRLVRMASDKESQVVSIERVAEFATMDPEPPLRVAATSPPRDWPSDGQIELRRFSMAYRRGLPKVLSNVSCVINAREKVGICGRTGAGKSSIMVALMRLADVMEGEILIDGLNTLTMGLHDVRCAMAIIPQEATLFKGTLRYNLVSAPTPAPRSECHPSVTLTLTLAPGKFHGRTLIRVYGLGLRRTPAVSSADFVLTLVTFPGRIVSANGVRYEVPLASDSVQVEQ